MRTCVFLFATVFSLPGLMLNDLTIRAAETDLKSSTSGVFCLSASLPARKPPESPQHFTFGDLFHRELLRQAVLITARERFGLATRDGMLREPLPQNDQDECLFHLDTEFVNKAHDEMTLRWKDQILFNVKLPWNYSTSPYIQVADRVGELIDKQLVEALEKAGLKSRSRPAGATSAQPTKQLASSLERMDTASQYSAVRLAHNAIAKQGENRELLGCLVRGYAHLGQLTGLHPCNMRYAFGGRAVLYATRMIRLEPDSPVGYWYRAYAFTILGLDFASLEDLKQADQRRSNHPKLTEPDWLPFLNAANRFEYETLGELTAKSAAHRELGALLCFRSVELADSETLCFGVGSAALQLAPDCQRIHEGMSRVSGVITGHLFTESAFDFHAESLKRTLLPRLKSSEALKADFADAGELMETVEGRAQLAYKLMEHAGVDEDLREPSFAVLGAMIDEANVLSVIRRGMFLRYSLGTNASGFMESVAPAYDRHPFKLLIRSIGNDPSTWEAFKRELTDFECPQGNLSCISPMLMYGPGDKFKTMDKNEYFNHLIMLSSSDELDYLIKAGLQTDPVKLEMTNWMTAIHPHSPFRITTQVRLNWDQVKSKADQWLTEYGRHPAVVLAIAGKLDEDGDIDRAEKLYRSVISAVHDAVAYERLIEFLWNVKHDSKAAMEVAREFFAKPDYGLSHSSLACQIAYQLLAEDKAEEALPWAEQAAESYSGSGLQVLADCYERLGKPNESAEILERIDQRYGGFTHYSYVMRTGKGNAEREFKKKMEYLSAIYPPQSDELQIAAGMHHLLIDKPEDARKALQPVLAGGRSPWNDFWGALVADRVGDKELRNSIWERTRKIPETDPLVARVPQWSKFQALAQALLTASAAETVNHDELEKLAAPDPVNGSPITIRLFVASWYDTRGDKERAIKFYRSAAQLPQRDDFVVIYAWRRLRELGDDPQKLIPKWDGLTKHVKRNVKPKT